MAVDRLNIVRAAAFSATPMARHIVALLLVVVLFLSGLQTDAIALARTDHGYAPNLPETPHSGAFCGISATTESLGLYYLRARYLNAANGRFWSMDSYEGEEDDPATLHKYLYANADPVNGSDPSGHLTMTEVMVVSAVIGMGVGVTVPSLRGTGPEIENGKFSDYFVQGLYQNGGLIAVTFVGTALGIEWGGAPVPKRPGEFALGSRPGYKDVTTRLSRLNLKVMEWMIKDRGNARASFKVLRFIGYVFRNARVVTNPVGAFAGGYVLGMVPTVAFLAAERSQE